MNATNKIVLWAQWEVITEDGELLGWVKTTVFNPNDNQSAAIVIIPFQIFWLPEAITGSYQLSASEIVWSSDKSAKVAPQNQRLITRAGAANRLCQTKVGLLQRLGLNLNPSEWKNDNSPSQDSSSDQTCDDDDNWSDWDAWDDDGFAPVPTGRPPNPGPIDYELELPLD